MVNPLPTGIRVPTGTARPRKDVAGESATEAPTDYLNHLDRLIDAVLLFHHGGTWTAENQAQWLSVTGKPNCSSRALCDFAREIREGRAKPMKPPKVGA